MAGPNPGLCEALLLAGAVVVSVHAVHLRVQGHGGNVLRGVGDADLNRLGVRGGQKLYRDVDGLHLSRPAG